MTTDLAIPDRMAHLPVDKHGRPVPWFVAWIDRKPDFRVIGADKIADAIRFEHCWICGRHRGRFGTFVIGPMCAVNRVSAEPPSHKDCATYAALACPFLTTPNMRRRPTDDVADAASPAGTMIRRNPGATLVWTSRTFTTFDDGNRHVLFDVGHPVEVAWYANGRFATRDEVMTSIETGLPILRAEADKDGPAAVAELERRLTNALRLVPQAVTS